jgi:hypothetical protein
MLLYVVGMAAIMPARIDKKKPKNSISLFWYSYQSKNTGGPHA